MVIFNLLIRLPGPVYLGSSSALLIIPAAHKLPLQQQYKELESVYSPGRTDDVNKVVSQFGIGCFGCSWGGAYSLSGGTAPDRENDTSQESVCTLCPFVFEAF